jgi:hypothetical protein
LGLSETQISFQPPDEDWSSSGAGTDRRLNIYLVDLRENRKFRSNQRDRAINNGVVSEEPVPARLDCHYLISAWSPIQNKSEATLAEHDLLYQVTGVLMQAISLNPARLYLSRPALDADWQIHFATWPEPFQNIDLPLTIAPVDGYLKLSEFWHSMGQKSRLKPVLYLIVTLPIALMRTITGSIVTTRITEYWQLGQTTVSDTWMQIGGVVLDSLNLQNDTPTPLSNAWVQLETLTDTPLQTTATDASGRFTFSGLKGDRYRLRTRVAGLGEKVRDVDVPAPSGEYNLSFP